MDTPLVSIVITSYNRSDLISNAIESALSQDYQNLEIIISDNNSTDNTQQVIEKYLSNPKVKFYRNSENIGMIPNFKLATEERAKGEFITYVSSDDKLVNNSFISDAVRIINNDKNIFIVFAKNQTYLANKDVLVDDKTHHLYQQKVMDGKDVFIRFADGKALGWGGAFIHRKELIKLNIFETKSTSLDYEANLLLMLKGNVGFIKEPTYVYRIHENQASQLKTANDVKNNYSYILRSYNYALEKNILSIEKLNKWKNDLFYLESQYILLQFLPKKKGEYKNLMQYFKVEHPVVYKRLRNNIKWQILTTLYSKPKFSIKLFRALSKPHFENLKNILLKGSD